MNPAVQDERPYFRNFDPHSVPSPCFVVDLAAVEWNLQFLRQTADRAGARVLLALKAFALPAAFPLVRTWLHGVCASGVYEARLGRQEVAAGTPLAVHTFAPAYSSREFPEILELSDHVIFNSLHQWHRFRHMCLQQGAADHRVFGLRINPEHSTGEVPLYDPCAPGSRLGITAQELHRQIRELTRDGDPLAGISEIHFHTLCESDSRALEETLKAVEDRFGDILARQSITEVNIGGGHHITRRDYDTDHLVNMVRAFQQRYNVTVTMEPGEAAAIHSGVLVSTVLDTLHNGVDVAILDTSATAHMPDTLEMPYRANIWGSTDDAPFLYRLGGQTCLAGDVMGDYRFHQPLKPGDRLVFDDMSHYTMVKTTTFNGIALPSIAVWDSRDGSLEVVRSPEYRDFRGPLG